LSCSPIAIDSNLYSTGNTTRPAISTVFKLGAVLVITNATLISKPRMVGYKSLGDNDIYN
jgi:hypothetical protein